MKKLFIYAAASLVLASCSSTDEIVPTSEQTPEITFKAHASRAAVDGSALKVGADYLPMYVTAYYAAKEGEDIGSNGQYFKHQKFEYVANESDATKSNWQLKNNKWYYPLNGTLTFMGYTCSLEDDNNSITADWTGYDAANNKETVLTFTSEKGLNDMLYSDANAVPCPGKTSTALKFKHGLAWLNFTFKSAENNPQNKIKINSVTVTGVNLGGTATVTYGQNGTAEIKWNVGENTAANALVPNFTAADLTTTASAFDADGIMIVPSTANSADAANNEMTGTTVIINYTIHQADGTSNDKTHTYTQSLNDYKWKAGNKYTYNFTITLDEITMSATVTDWPTDANNHDVDINKNN